MMSVPSESDKMSQLERLPVELQCRILTSIPNMKSLRALISASPRFFQVYQTCEEEVYSHVAWNHITPAVVPIALKALEQRGYSGFKSDKIVIKEPREIPWGTWESLLRFHRTVDSLISHFASSRLAALENSMHLHKQTASSRELPDRHLNLSQLEYGRLARAFYHLELYSYVKGYSKREMLMESWTFMQSLRDWELEELLCVRSYLIERLLVFLNKFEEDFMEAYLKHKPCITWPHAHAGKLDWRHKLFVDNNHPNLWPEDKNKADEWIENCLTRGLKYLSRLFSADHFWRKFYALDRMDGYYHWMTYAMVNARRHPKEEVTAEMEGPSVNGLYNNIEQPNEAWFWAPESNALQNKPCEGRDTNDFQRWGYVIWDHARLERLGILTKSPQDIQAIIGTDWLVKKTPKCLEARTSEQEEIWSQEGLQSTLTEPRPVFDWEKPWFQ